MKKIVSLILALSVSMSASISALPTDVFAESETTTVTEVDENSTQSEWEYSTYGDGVELTAYNGNQTDVYAPSSIEADGERLNVLKLGDGLFEDRTDINSVTLGEGIAEIGESTFEGATGLVCIVTPESLTTIGANAFNGCTSFNSVILYDAVESIGENAFSGCENLTVYCNEGTTAYDYVVENGIKYEILNPDEIPRTVVVDDATYYISNGEAWLMSFVQSERVVIPSTVNGVPVTRIRSTGTGKNDSDSDSACELYLPDTLTVIPDDSIIAKTTTIFCSPGSAAHKFAENNHCPYVLNTYGTFPHIVTEGDFTYYIINGEYAALKSCNQSASGTINVPSVIENYPVRKILGTAFKKCSKITDIVLPSSISDIFSEAFSGCSSLKSVNIPENVTTIFPYIFQYCYNLKNVDLHNNITRIENYAFAYSGFEKIYIPENLEYLGSSAFYGLNLSEFIYPKYATVSDKIFLNCTVDTVIIPRECENLSYNSFLDSYDELINAMFVVYKNSQGQVFVEENDVPLYYFLDGEAPQYLEDDYFSYIILNGEAVIKSCYNLPYIEEGQQGVLEIPEYAYGYPITKIQDYAFSETFDDSDIYWEVILPESVTYIGKGAFIGNCNLIKINIPKNIKIINDGTFAKCGLTDIELPEGLEVVGEGAFAYCKIKQIGFPSTLKSIKECAFEGSYIETLNYPNVEVGRLAFSECENLREVVIEEGVTSLPERVFEDGQMIERIYVPNTLTEVEDYPFMGCSRLTLITSRRSQHIVKYAENHGIMWCSNDHYSMNVILSTEEYSENGINYFLVRNLCNEELYSAVVLPGEYDFETNVVIPEYINYNNIEYKVIKIGDSAFDDAKIIGIDLPDTIVYFGDRAFRGSTIRNIKLPPKLKYIGATALNAGLYGKIVCPACLVGPSAFAATYLESVDIEEGVTVIPKYAFTENKKLTDVTLPESLELIEYYAFSEMGLKQITIPGNTILEEDAFVGLSNLEKIVICEGMTSLSKNFRGCANLAQVYLPKSLTYIDYGAFTNCPRSVFCVYENSYAYEYCEKKGLPFFILDKTDNPEISYGAGISGAVTYTDGTAVSGATVEILYDDGTVKESVVTDESGAYNFTYAEVGRYTIRVTDANGNGGSEVIFVKRMNVFDVFLAGETDLVIKQGYTVSGEASASGIVTVTLTDLDGNIIDTVTTENGKYTFENVPNGTYIIIAEGENGSASKEITVFGGDIEAEKLEIAEQSAAITGYVEVEDRDKNHHRRNWVQVTVYNSEGIAVAQGKTNKDGMYSFDKLPFGDYAIVAEVSEMRPDKHKKFDRSHTLTGYAYITLNQAKNYEVDTIVLREENDSLATVSGKVTAKGQTQRCEVTITNVFRHEMARCTTGNNGKYTFKNIKDGLYFITAVTESDGMGYTVIAIRDGEIFGETDITVAKKDIIREHEEKMNLIAEEDVHSHRDDIAAEKKFYDGLSEKEKKQFSKEYIDRLNRYCELIAGGETKGEGATLHNGGMIISGDELDGETTVEFVLTVEETSLHTISDEGIKTREDFMQQSIEDTAGDKTIAKYYDISLKKNVNGVEHNITKVSKHTDTTGKLRITMEIPEEYRGHKHYSFVHMHNGVPTTLVDLDDNPDTVTFEVDRFSTFALAYSDTELTEESETYPASITYSDGKIKVSSTETGKLYIATYEGEILLSVKTYDIAAGDTDKEFEFNSNQKAYIWNSDMQPLCES